MTGADTPPGGTARRRACLIGNRLGLHARAAAKFVKTAAQFDAEISVSRDDMRVSGLSILGLMMLAAGPGTEIEIEARGRDAERALAALAGLVDSGFDED